MSGAHVVEDRELGRTVGRAQFRVSLRWTYGVFCLSLLSHVVNAQSVTPVCDRTEEVRDAIVALVPDTSDCQDVTASDLAAIEGTMDLNEQSIKSLKAGDFSGLSSLTRLELLENQLASLPDDVFVGLPKLLVLLLGANRLTELRSAHLNGLPSVTLLDLHGNSLASLPADLFGGLPALRSVQLGLNDLTSLPDGLFSGLSSLAYVELGSNALSTLRNHTFEGLDLAILGLAGNRLGSLPSDVFNGLPLEFLSLNNNDLTGLPDGLFGGQSELATLFLQDNPDSGSPPLGLTISLEQVGGDGFKATAPAGAPFGMVLPITVTGGSIPNDSLTIPAGGVTSDAVTVTPTGMPDEVSVDIGDLPALPTDHRGYRLVKDPDLPLVLHPNGPDLVVLGPSVSDRNPQTGGTFRLLVTVTNQGNSRSATTTLRYHRSADATISTSDTSVGTALVSSLGMSQGAGKTTRLTAPAAAGTYFYGGCVDAVEGESDATNNCSVSVSVDVSSADEPVASVNDAEGTEGTTQDLAFEVALDEAGAVEATVDYATVDGTATAGSDYSETTGTLTFTTGETRRTIRVPLLDDTAEEPDETFLVRLSNPTGATLDDGEATGTIRDDDQANRSPTGEVTIIGTATERETLTAEADLEDADGLGTFEHAWLADDRVIPGAAGRMLALTQAEVGRRVKVRLSYTDGRGTAESIDSEPTARVANVNDPPVGEVAITGEAVRGGTLTADASDVVDPDGPETLDFDYQWLADGEPIAGEASETLLLTDGEVGRAIAGRIGYVDAWGTRESVTSPETEPVAEAATRTHTIPLFPSALSDRIDGVVRVINRTPDAGEVTIDAFDDAGRRFGPLTLSIGAYETVHFTSDDLESGNPDLPLQGVTGSGQGDWHLALTSDLDIEALCYARGVDGFFTTLNAVAPNENGTHRVATLNPGYNTNQVGRLRLVNPTDGDAEASVHAVDGAGNEGGMPMIDLPAGGARTFTSEDLEPGDGDGVRGGLGSADGKWRLTVESERELVVMSLVSTPTGHLTNFLTASSNEREGIHVVRYLPPASNTLGRQGFVRVINRSAQAAEVSVAAEDDSSWEYEPVVLTVAANAAAHFNTDDLEQGNESKGLSAGVGAGQGDWRLELTGGEDIEVVSFMRTRIGFVTALDGVAIQADDGSPRYYLPFFLPADHAGQEGHLRLANSGDSDAAVTIHAMDDRGEGAPDGSVGLSLQAGTTLTLTAAQLEQGTEDLSGRLGDGSGYWQLWIQADAPLEVMGLGHPTRPTCRTWRPWTASRGCCPLRNPATRPSGRGRGGR